MIEFALLVIAGSALWVSLRKLDLDAKDRRIAVKPHLRYCFENTDPTHTIEIDLLNAGVGPALVKHFSIEVGGTNQPIPRDPHAIRDLLTAAGFIASVGTVGVPDSGAMIAVGEKIRILKMTVHPPKGTAFDNQFVHSILTLHCKYECLYGETQTSSTDDELN